MWCVRYMLTEMDTRWWQKQQVPQKCQYSSTNVYGVISQDSHLILSFCNWCRFTFTHVICVCFSFPQSPHTSDIVQTVYIKSHARASPYFVGITVGYLLPSTFKISASFLFWGCIYLFIYLHPYNYMVTLDLSVCRQSYTQYSKCIE